jgi:hypothetical protein
MGGMVTSTPRLRGRDVGQHLGAREHEVEGGEEDLELLVEVAPDPGVGEDGQARAVVAEVSGSVRAEDVQDRVTALREAVDLLLLQPAQRPHDVAHVVDREGVLEVGGHAAVVDHQARALPVVVGPVHPRDGLEQLGPLHPPVEVQGLLHGGVEAGEQHRLDDEDGRRPMGSLVREDEGLLEEGDPALGLRRVGPLAPGGVVRLASGRDDHREVHGAEDGEPPVRPHQEGGLRVGRLGPRNQLGIEGGEAGRELVTRDQERLAVTDGGAAAHGHDLGLEAVGEDVLHVVAEHVAGLVRDERRGFEDVAAGRVPGLERGDLGTGVDPEHVLEDAVEVAPSAHRGVGRPALVEDLQRRAVLIGLPEPVAIDEFAEDLVRVLLVAHEDGRAGEADAGTVGQGTIARCTARNCG